jgi:hypothetical protein
MMGLGPRASGLGIGVVVVIAACSAPKSPASAIPPTPLEPPRPKTAADRILPLLPDGAQVVIEFDLARLRGNAVVGQVATRAIARIGGGRVPGLPIAIAGSPLADADAIVLASYGVGTAQAATVAVIATTGAVPDATTLAPGLVALGPAEWIAQLQTRAAIDGRDPCPAISTAEGRCGSIGERVAAPKELLALRDHAMPKGATGAVLRVTARLPFDARVALARETGLDAAPARVSVWGDVADDLVVVLDADAADPGDRASAKATKRLAATLRAALVGIASDSTIRALGVPYKVADAKLIEKGSWVRAIIEIEPRQLARAVQRAGELLGAGS